MTCDSDRDNTLVPRRLSTREGYDRWSASYDDDANPMVGLDSRILPPLIGDVSGLNAVDLGCGTGRHTIWMARAGARVTGLDASPGMLAEARRRSQGLDICLLLGDLAADLPSRPCIPTCFG